jgi:hypothetical protein
VVDFTAQRYADTLCRVFWDNIFVIPDKNAVVVRLGHERSNERIGSHTADVFLYIDAALEILNEFRFIFHY